MIFSAQMSILIFTCPENVRYFRAIARGCLGRLGSCHYLLISVRASPVTRSDVTMCDTGRARTVKMAEIVPDHWATLGHCPRTLSHI